MTSDSHSPDSPQARAAAVRLMAFDVDGTLTDGGLYIGAQGESVKRFSVRDGLGLVLLRQNGIVPAIVTGRRSDIVEQRARELGIDTVMQGVGDKAQALRDLAHHHQLSLAQCGFMGDDWPDLPALLAVGFAATVPDAAPEVKRVAHWVSRAGAGQGAARELAEYLLRSRGLLQTALGRFDGRAS
jgi:3-deoxy-D-manno-octulosonate 8-phosphate phosphatase (KDO 8-P phosphatase)